MASAATLVSNAYPNGADNTQRRQRVQGKVTISSGTYPAGGFALSWGIEGIKGLPGSGIPSGGVPFNPVWVVFKSIAHPPSGYDYEYDGTSGNMRVFEGGGSAPNAEISGSTPAGVTGDTIEFLAEFIRD
jgi:hypothetical protein